MSKKIKIGYSLSLSGPLAANGQTARLTHEVWQHNINTQGGLLGRDVELLCVDDQSDATNVEGIYRRLLVEEKVDLLLGGYGNNSISPAMPVAMENGLVDVNWFPMEATSENVSSHRLPTEGLAP